MSYRTILAILLLLLVSPKETFAIHGSGAALPATCTIGDTFTVLPISSVFNCTATNVWSPQAPIARNIACGRLTLTTGVPVTSADVTSSTNIFYTPYNCNQISLYDGSSAWTALSFSELTCALGTLTSDKNYDVFIYNNAGTPACEFSAAWTNDSTRADALTTQDGVNVKSGATTRRYVGTFRTISTTQTADTGGGTTTQVGGKRFVWNNDNRVETWLRVIEATDTWAYTTAAWRVANGATAPLNCVEFVVGQPGVLLSSKVLAFFVNTASVVLDINAAVSYDSSTAPSGLRDSATNNLSGIGWSLSGSYMTHPDIGYHYSCWLEFGDTDMAANTMRGDAAPGQSGLEATTQR